MIFQTSMIMFHVNLQGCTLFIGPKDSHKKTFAPPTDHRSAGKWQYSHPCRSMAKRRVTRTAPMKSGTKKRFQSDDALLGNGLLIWLITLVTQKMNYKTPVECKWATHISTGSSYISTEKSMREKRGSLMCVDMIKTSQQRHLKSNFSKFELST